MNQQERDEMTAALEELLKQKRDLEKELQYTLDLFLRKEGCVGSGFILFLFYAARIYVQEMEPNARDFFMIPYEKEYFMYMCEKNYDDLKRMRKSSLDDDNQTC